jgi:hypothetical protein
MGMVRKLLEARVHRLDVCCVRAELDRVSQLAHGAHCGGQHAIGTWCAFWRAARRSVACLDHEHVTRSGRKALSFVYKAKKRNPKRFHFSTAKLLPFHSSVLFMSSSRVFKLQPRVIANN